MKGHISTCHTKGCLKHWDVHTAEDKVCVGGGCVWLICWKRFFAGVEKDGYDSLVLFWCQKGNWNLPCEVRVRILVTSGNSRNFWLTPKAKVLHCRHCQAQGGGLWQRVAVASSVSFQYGISLFYAMALSTFLSTTITTVIHITIMSLECHQMSLVNCIHWAFATKFGLIYSVLRAIRCVICIHWLTVFEYILWLRSIHKG